MEQIEQLDPLSFPLNGNRLIEASAGTGKTYTLAALYVRLVLGQGAEGECFTRALIPPEILVVTFTNAATLELRDRIRARLAECAAIFRGLQSASDPFTQELLSSYSDEAAKATAALLLERAANWMDEAAIFTIHGWAQRMLKEHAFDSGASFDAELETEDRGRLQQVARDYWRIFCVGIDARIVGVISDLFKNPEQLVKWVSPLLTRDARIHWGSDPLIDARAPGELAPALLNWTDRRADLIEQLLACWRASCDQIEGILRDSDRADQYNRRSLPAGKLDELLVQMRSWSEQTIEPEKADDLLSRLNLTKKQMKAKFEVPLHPASDLLAQIAAQQSTKPDASPALLHALDWIRQRFIQIKSEQSVLEFDDLLLNLASALQRDQDDKLHQRIRTQFPVAMIDEFQDTDPLQYQIFRSLYLDAPESALMMIGDPKQAIYSFRGADIHTYLRARSDVGSNLYSLPRNFRSSQQLVTGVNGLFAQAESREEGAFRFKGDQHNPIPFIEVAAQGRAERFLCQGEPQEGLNILLYNPEEEGAVAAGEYRRIMAEICAERIVELLSAGQQGQAMIGDQQVQAGQIAVLVRSGTEAKAIRGALDQRGVPSVYLSDKENIYETAEALDLWRCLSAVINPRSTSSVLAALASPSLMSDPRWIEQIQADELQWEAEVDRFIELGVIWRRAGVLAVIRKLLELYQVPQRLLARPDGERSLTNLLHLAELLQKESRRVEGEQGIVRFLAEQILQPTESGDQRILRMESDASRVQVVTLHKSKGLEYPLVFIPFGVNSPVANRKNEGLLLKGDQGEDIYVLGTSSSDAKAQAELARNQEDIRLLYVGLTRPKYACWMGVAPIRSVEKSAFGQLLGLSAKTSAETFAEQVCRLEGVESVYVEEVRPSGLVTQAPKVKASDLKDVRRLDRPVVPSDWVISSYSAIASRIQGTASGQVIDESHTSESDQMAEMRDQSADRNRQGAEQSIHSFYRGAQAGTYLHAVLERAAELGFADTLASNSLRVEALQLEYQSSHWSDFQQVLDDWLVSQLGCTMPLGTSQASLSDLTIYKPEVEFWFSLTALNLDELDQLCIQAVMPGQERPALYPRQLNGMIKGFIDLVFELEGQYWIADYKSNHLGPDLNAYTQAKMAETVLHSRYDLQLLIYLLALHRLLQARDSVYAADPQVGYETRIGGAAYLFLRGIEEPENRGVFQCKPSYELIERLDLLMKGDS